MKFRTDFVTNISITCFVFKEKEMRSQNAATGSDALV